MMGYESDDAAMDALSCRHERVTHAVLGALVQLLPSLDIEAIRTKLQKTLSAWCDLLAHKDFDREQAIKLGSELPYIDDLQPIDVLTLQRVILDALLEDSSDHLPVTVVTRVHEALSAFTLGLFNAKRQRVAQANVAAVSKLSHDLKNPINSINGFSWVILKEIDGPITEYQREDLTSIHEAGKKLLDMINDTFAGLKQNATHTLIHDEVFHVWSFLSDVLHALEPAMTQGKQWFQLVLAGDPGLMKADAGTLRIVLLSLLSYFARCANESTLSLVVMRQKIEADDWLLFRIERHAQGDLMATADGAWALGLPSKPLGLDQDPDRDNWINTDVALTAAYRLSRELAANLSMEVVSKDSPCEAFTLWIPAGINQTDEF